MSKSLRFEGGLYYLATIKIRRKAVAIAVVITTIVSLLSIYGILYILTPYSGFARSIIWQDSDIKDYERFPFRIIDNAPPVFHFITQDTNSTAEESKINGSFLSSPVLFNKIVPNGDTEGKKKSFDEFLASTGTTAFVVIKNDEILYEKYFNGYHEESINTSFSMAKSITSALIGIAIDQGMIQSVDDPIAKYLPELRQKDPSFNSITLKNLLTMSSGLRYIEEGLPWSDDSRTYYDTDLRSLALSAKVEEQPGKRFHYNNYNALLLGMILERTTHMNVSQYLEEKIWKPLGMEASASWSLDSDAHGFEKMESGINARAIDFAKIGRLFLNNGNWNGKQIISEIWVNESTRPDMITDPAQFYQYMWWVENAQKEGNYHFFAVGKYGQYIYVIPEKNMIIVRHGYESGYDGWTNLFKNIARIV